MTPKERAEELVDTFRETIMSFLSDNMKHQNAKKCAIVSVDQIILEQCKGSELKDPRYQDERLMYWNEVKQEIEKI
jgi:hypothetical protein